jgi:hypothetical protein
MNSDGEKEIFEYVDNQGYISTSTGEKYVPANRNSGDEMFLMYPDATDKTSNKMEVQTNGSTSKDILVKKQEVEIGDNKKSNPLSRILVRATGNPNIGKFGCSRRTENATCIYNEGTGNKNHHGVDLMAQVGAEAFSMYDGRIIEIRNSNFEIRTEQFKNRNLDVYGKVTSASNKGRDGCHYAEGSFGKQIIVEYKSRKGWIGIDGENYKTIYVLYGHLNRVIKTSGVIKSGEKIAECGCSGNAASLDEGDHHIHLEASTSASDFIMGKKRKINIETLIMK